jgi:hypothetical protein
MGGHSVGRHFEDAASGNAVTQRSEPVKPIKKKTVVKVKAAKILRAAAGAATSAGTGAKAVSSKKSHSGTASCPDERRPQVKADEIYGDTEIAQHHRKRNS